MYPKDFPHVSKNRLLFFGLRQARTAIARCWKNVDPPTLAMWIKELSNCIDRLHVTSRVTSAAILEVDSLCIGRVHVCCCVVI